MAVYQRNGTWWIDFYYQDKRHRQKIGTTKKGAETALNQIKVKIAAGEYVPQEELKRQEALKPKPVIFENFAIQEFLPWSQMEHSANHHDRLRLVISTHLVPYFKDRSLEEITVKMIEDYKRLRRRKPYKRGRKNRTISEATVNRELCAIKVILRKAEEWDKIDQSPARAVKTFKETPTSPRLLETEEVVRFLDAVPDRLKALISCTVYAGLRKAELFRLRWEDINWKTNELKIASRRGEHTKNYQSRRVPMNDALVEALRRHPRTLKSPYVFCNYEAQPYRDIRVALDSASKVAMIEGRVRLHQLRHTFCSHALMQGIDPRTVQKWMGHRDLKTTLRYAHVSPDHERAAIQRLNYQETVGDKAHLTQAG
jgi:integrase